MRWFKNLIGSKPSSSLDSTTTPSGAKEGLGSVSRDTQDAITELANVARNNPDAVEIYLALGNLYRSHGEIERAVQIRQNLIVRPGLNSEFQAKAWFELGKDFKRGGFLDRAMAAFEQARKISGDGQAISGELALLTAASGDFERASRYYSQIGNPLASAHYMVRLGQEQFALNNDPGGFKWVRKALARYPGSLEAWLELLRQDLKLGNWQDLAKHMDKALDSVVADLRFVLLEGLLDEAKRQDMGEHCVLHTDRPFQYQPQREITDALLPLLEKRDSELLLHFYAAWMQSGVNPEGARLWLERTLVLNPEFWPARLELLALDMHDQTLTEAFSTQIEFFVNRARQLKRFVCRRCGLKREQLFFTCPRCGSWHSIKYRLTINE